MSSEPNPWATRLEPEVLGTGRAQVAIQIEALAHLDHAIDALFEELASEFPEDPARVHAALDERCPYFGCVWPAARALAEEVLEKNMGRVLELGCGLALPSLALAATGRTALATDFHAEVPRFLERNRSHNQIPPERLPYLAIDWRQGLRVQDLALLRQFEPDSVIASDVLYEKEQPARVASCLTQLFGQLPSLRFCALTDPGRPYLQSFSDEMRQKGWEPKISSRTVRDGTSTKDVFVLSFER